MIDDEDAFKAEVFRAATDNDYVNYQEAVEYGDDGEDWLVVELYTGDRFRIMIEAM